MRCARGVSPHKKKKQELKERGEPAKCAAPRSAAVKRRSAGWLLILETLSIQISLLRGVAVGVLGVGIREVTPCPFLRLPERNAGPSLWVLEKLIPSGLRHGPHWRQFLIEMKPRCGLELLVVHVR